MGIPFTDEILRFIDQSECVAMSVMQPPAIRACFQKIDHEHTLGIDPGLKPEECTLLAYDMDAGRGTLTLVWINQPDLMKKAQEAKHD